MVEKLLADIQVVKDYVENNLVPCKYCPTERMIADITTKPLPAQVIDHMLKLNLIEERLWRINLILCTIIHIYFSFIVL